MWIMSTLFVMLVRAALCVIYIMIRFIVKHYVLTPGWFGVVVTAFITSVLLWAQLVLEFVTTFGGSTIPVFIQATQAHSAWPPIGG